MCQWSDADGRSEQGALAAGREVSVSWSRTEMLYDGKSKRVFETTDPSRVIVQFKDDATAFNGVKHAIIADKAAVNQAISTHLFGLVAEQGVAHHLVEVLGPTEWLCERVEIIPVEVVVRNFVAGSLAKRYGVEEGAALPWPLVELFYKSDALNDPLLGDDVAIAMGWSRRWELAFMKEQALAVNEVLSGYWADLNVDLVDFKLEFGRTDDGRILLADEITPDGSRLWEKGTRKRFDKDVFRRDLGDLGDRYRELYEKVFGQRLAT